MRRVAVLVLLLAVAGGTFLAVAEREDDPARPAAQRSADAPRAAAGGTAPPDRGTAATRPIVRFEVGRGARGAAIVRRAGSQGRRPVVIFLHGWGITAASAYRPWVRHLAATGNTVIVPRYQRNARSRPDRVRANALAGIRAALRVAPPAPGSLVVAGHSAGGALAADYAGLAADRGLPRPAAVFAVYPGRRINVPPGVIPEVDPARIARGTHLLVLAGARDAVVGEAPARALVAGAVRVPEARRRLIRVSTPRAADHDAPTRSGRDVRAAFWRRLDRLIDRARG